MLPPPVPRARKQRGAKKKEAKCYHVCGGCQARMSEAALQQRELVVRSCVRSPSRSRSASAEREVVSVDHSHLEQNSRLSRSRSRSRSASGEKEVEGGQPAEVVSESPAKRARRGSSKREVESDELSFSSNSSRVIS